MTVRDKLIERARSELTVDQLILGWLRYEALRRQTPMQFDELYKRNMEGKPFDDLVDEVLLRWKSTL